MALSLFNNFYNEGPTSATFIVEVDGKMLGEFREVNGLSAEIEVQEVREGGQNDWVHKLPGRIKYSDVTLKRGMTLDNGMYNWLSEWTGVNYERFGMLVRRQTVAITLKSSSGSRLRTWVLTDAFPTKWTGPQLSIENDSFLYEEIVLCHQGMYSTNLAVLGQTATKPNIKRKRS